MGTQPTELIETILIAALAAVEDDDLSTISAISIGVDVASRTHRPTTTDLTTARKNVEGLIFARGGYNLTAALQTEARAATISQTLTQIIATSQEASHANKNKEEPTTD